MISAFFCLCLCLGVGVVGQSVVASKIHPAITKRISQQFKDHPPTPVIPVILVMRTQFDFSNSDAQANWVARGNHVHSSLVETARTSQMDLLSRLARLNGISRIRPFHIVNAVAVDIVDQTLLSELDGRDDIAFIEPNFPFAVALERPGSFEAAFGVQKERYAFDGDRPFGMHPHPHSHNQPVANEWNIDWIRTQSAWDAGYRGEGMIYANADTGVEWRHETLVGNYYGMRNASGDLSLVDHNYAWWDGVKRQLAPVVDVCGIDVKAPCDGNGHGSHTTSTTVGSLGVGVAPAAQWMACRNMDNGYGSSESYLNCLEFFMAPTDLTGLNARSDLRPHAIGNSYGCPSSEGCAVNAFTRAVENLRRAGIFMSVSAGNDGPGCSTVSSPPGYEVAVISVGAGSYQSPAITYFSSRGPSYHLGADQPVRKPDVTAPGQNVRAAYISRSNPYSSYAKLSGTSMASPHVGGAVLLLSQACPCIARDVDQLQNVLQDTAHHYTTGARETKAATCGGDAPGAVPNNIYGYGGIDIADALTSCLATCGK